MLHAAGPCGGPSAAPSEAPGLQSQHAILVLVDEAVPLPVSDASHDEPVLLPGSWRRAARQLTLDGLCEAVLRVSLLRAYLAGDSASLWAGWYSSR
jgi:hypothetical protein